MPSINNFKPKKQFKKKSYRPWDDNLFPTEINLDNQDICDKEKTDLKTENNYCPYKKILLSLYGSQIIILKYLLKNIDEEYANYLLTKPIRTADISTELSMSVNTVKSTIQVLKSRSLLNSFDNKKGKGGFAIYRFNKDIFEFFNNNL